MSLLPLLPCRPDDGPALAHIHAACFEAPWDSLSLNEIINSSGIIALRDSSGCGFVLLRQTLDEGEILTLAVKPEARKKGLGRALMEQAQHLAWQAGAHSLFLEVAIDNQAALNLYKNLGYCRVGKRPGYYNRPGGAVDAVLMRLSR